MNGRIIVVEGADVVDKAIYIEKLKEKLTKIGFKIYYHKFPTNSEKQSSLASMLENGEFKENEELINFKVASCFYAVDRMATYLLTLKKKIDEGYIVILDRYTTTNMLYQATLGETKTVINKAADWISKFEYKDLGLPRPDVEIYLSLDRNYCEEILPKLDKKMQKRFNNDVECLNRIIKAELFVARGNNWDIIECNDKENMKSEEQISSEMYRIVLSRI